MTNTTNNLPNQISHEGHVVDVFESGVDVSIIAEAACGSCKMKKACGMDESQEKIITVFTPDAHLFKVGEHVEVLMKQAMGYKAIAIVYVVPVVLVMIALIATVQLGLSEMTAGLASLGFLALYYFVVYLLRDKISREIRFEIRIPKNTQL
ncbi:SoxR reducing system RseC family protein [Alistipes sp. OttesenSCG-928-L06]|nr:SoxR reducing system RseC family protein [Alistipes sp. OttesenSCG-928-L06]